MYFIKEFSGEIVSLPSLSMTAAKIGMCANVFSLYVHCSGTKCSADHLRFDTDNS